METEDISQAEVVESIHRSPHTFEMVDPTNLLGDQRKQPKNVEARVAGHRAKSNCGSEQLLANNDELNPVIEAEANDPDRLFNASTSNPPNFAVMAEKPEHRLIVYLKAQGLSNKEVADRTGYTQPWVSQITRQPWFRLRLTQELKEAGVDAINQVLKASALDSVFTLIELRDDATSPKAVRKSCADSLLDRFIGKAILRTEDVKDKLPSTTEIKAIESELSDIDKELQSNGKTELQTSS